MPPTATERAYRYTKDRILDGRFAGGEVISEGDVAAAVRLSRTPVREAFLRLEVEGLLKLYPRRGAVVVPVSAAEVEDVMEARRVLEVYAVELAAGRETDLGERLDRLIADQERLLSAGAARGFVESDQEFHRVIVAATGNAIFIELHDALRDRLSRMGLAALARDRSRMQTIVTEHREIAAGIHAGDAARAGELMRRHLEQTLALLRAGPR